MSDWVTDLTRALADAGLFDDPLFDGKIVESAERIIRKHVPRCDSCAHWEKDYSRDDEGICMKARDNDPKMWAGMYDFILTEPDFGCTQWEKKA